MFNPLPVVLSLSFDRRWHGPMLRWWEPVLAPGIASNTTLGSCINRGYPSTLNTLHLSNTSLSSSLLRFSSCIRARQSYLGELGSLKKRPLGMNSNMSSSKVMLSYYIYSHTYELEYSYCVIILIYELVYSLYVMRVAHSTLCLTII
jgi:hypothetical protein